MEATAEQVVTHDKVTWEGLIPAVFTPMTQNGEINLDVIPTYAQFLVNNGIKTVFVNGTTGESLSLTSNERKAVAEAWVKEKKTRGLRVMVHVGAQSLYEAQDLARHAGALGVDAISLMSPTFFKPATLDLLVKFCHSVAACCPTMPFFYYHIPPLTNVNFSMQEFLEKAGPVISNLHGIKFSSLDLTELNQIRRHAGGRYSILYGVDQQFLAAMLFGVKGAIGSLYNFLAPTFNKMITCWSAGDVTEAARYQSIVQDVVNTVLKFGTGTGAWKAAMTILSPVDVGPPRQPLEALTDEQQEELKQQILQVIKD